MHEIIDEGHAAAPEQKRQHLGFQSVGLVSRFDDQARMVGFLLAGMGLCLAQSTPVVSNIAIDALSHSSLRLTWNNSSPINAIRVRYGFTTAYDLGPGGFVMTPGTSEFTQLGQTASLSGLMPDTPYHFCPQASADGGRTWSLCVDVAATTLPRPDIHPAPPAPPTAVDVTYPVQNGSTLSVAADCSNLQDQLNQAQYGDTISIPAGTTCSDSYVLPNAREAVTFESSAVNTLTDQITIPNHGFTDGQEVHLDTAGCLPGSAGPDAFCQERGVLPGSDYFIGFVDANTVQLRASATGAPLSFTVASFTVNPVTSTMTIPSTGTMLRDGTPIQVRSSIALPGGLTARTTYYILNPSNSLTVQLAASPGGQPVLLANAGQGTHYFTDPGSGTHYIMEWPPANNGWIIVRTATPDAAFCPDGVRCLGSIWAGQMARIAQMTPPTGTFADVRLQTGFLSHHWRFVGIEFTHADNSVAAQSSTDPTPYFGFIYTRRTAANIILDRCYIHGLGFPNRIYRAIVNFDGENMAIVNSDLEKLDYWHPSVSSTKDFLPTIAGPKTLQLAPGTYNMGVKTAVISSPVTITLTGGTGGGTGVVYLTLDGTLQVVLPNGLQATCSGGGVPCSVTNAATPSYPNDANGRIMVAQISDLSITAGAFSSFAFRAGSPQSVNDSEGAQSFIAGNGPGPVLLQNNLISGTGIPIHFDDSGGWWYDRHDYVVRRNLFTAPLTQEAGGPQSDGLHYFHRQMIEWKGGQRILVDGNIFQNSFADVTPLGAALVLTPRAGGYVSDVMISNNTFSQNAGGIALAAIDSYTPVSKPLERVSISNNLFHHNDGYQNVAISARPAATGVLLYYGYAAADLRFDHNTLYDNRGYDPVYMHLVLDFIEGTSFTNNIFWVNDDASRRGVDGESYSTCPGVAEALMDCAFVAGTQTEYTFARNMLFPGWTNSAQFTSLLDPAALQAAYPGLTENWVINGASIGERLANAGLNAVGAGGGDFRVQPQSPYAAGGSFAASDGTALGANIDQLEQAQGLMGPAVATGILPSVAMINVAVPDPGAACYVLYGTGTDVTQFSRTTADTTSSEQRSLLVSGLEEGLTYNFVVVCSGASNASTGSVTPTYNVEKIARRPRQ